MGSPYLSSKESIILSTNNIIINTVPAEAILTSERLILVVASHTEFKPQDVPFTAIETVTTGESPDLAPMLSLSMVTGPGVTQALGIVFPQAPGIKREAERDEWAARLKELAAASARDHGVTATTLLPPWVSGPAPEETGGEGAPSRHPEAESKFINPPLTPRKTREPAPDHRVAIAGVIVVIIVIALAAIYLTAPALLGMGKAPVPPVTTAPTTVPTTVQTPVPATPVTTAATARTTVTTAPAAVIPVPQQGVWLRVKYEGEYKGTAGAPGRYREIVGTGEHFFQLSVKNETVFVTIQKQDNTGRTMTVELYDNGKLLRSMSITAPKGIVNLNAEVRTA